jgi:hypothetical protein
MHDRILPAFTLVEGPRKLLKDFLKCNFSYTTENWLILPNLGILEVPYFLVYNVI